MKQCAQHRIGIALAGLALTLAATLVGCQEVDQPKTTLTQKQWQEVKGHILKEKPDPEYPIGANYADKIELIGFDVSKPLVAGKPATFTWYWKALQDIDDNWKVFVHFDSSKKAYRQNLGHHPVGGLYQTSRWEKGQIIEDVQKVTINGNYPAGQAVPYIGFYKGKQRLAIKNGVKKTKDRRVIGPPLTVKNPNERAQNIKAIKELPRYSVNMIDDADLAKAKIDGKLDEAFWKKARPISLHPFGSAPDLHTQVYAVRTKDALLIGAKLPDDNIWGTFDKRDSKTWTQEVLELYIDKGRDAKNYLELQITPKGTIFDADYVDQLGHGKGSTEEQIKRASAWNMKGLKSAVYVDGTLNKSSDKDKFWSVELQIPFTSIPGVDAAPKPGEQWAVNFYRYDRPDKRRTYAYAWSKPNAGTFHQVERFGTFRFGNAPAQKPTAGKAPSGKSTSAVIHHINPAQLRRLQNSVKLSPMKPMRLRKSGEKAKGAKKAPKAKAAAK